MFYAFDLVRLDGWNLAAVPLKRRKELLRQLLPGPTGRSAIQFSDHVAGGGQAFYEQVSQLGLEGVVSKRASAPYQPGRSKTWTKAKAKLTGDFVIAGFTVSAAAGGLAALALGEWVDGELQLPRQGRHRLRRGDAARPLRPARRRSRTASWRSPGRRRTSAGCGRCSRRGSSTRISPPTARCATAVFMGLREVELSAAGAGGADAADLGGRPRDGLGDQPDAAAVRQVGADQARRRDLLRGDRRLHAAAPLRPAGQPGALPDRQARATASSSATSSSACRRASTASRPRPATRRTAPT